MARSGRIETVYGLWPIEMRPITVKAKKPVTATLALPDPKSCCKTFQPLGMRG